MVMSEDRAHNILNGSYAWDRAQIIPSTQTLTLLVKPHNKFKKMSLTASLSSCLDVLLAHLIRLLFVRFFLFIQFLLPFPIVSRSTLAFAILFGHHFLNHLPSLVLAYLPRIIQRLTPFISAIVYNTFYRLVNLRNRANDIRPLDSSSLRDQNPSRGTRRNKSPHWKRIREPNHSYNLRKRETHEIEVKVEPKTENPPTSVQDSGIRRTASHE